MNYNFRLCSLHKHYISTIAWSDKNSSIVKHAISQRVGIVFGNGTILNINKGNNLVGFHYVLELPVGIVFFRPSAILHYFLLSFQYSFTRRGRLIQPAELLDYMNEKNKKVKYLSQLTFSLPPRNLFIYETILPSYFHVYDDNKISRKFK